MKKEHLTISDREMALRHELEQLRAEFERHRKRANRERVLAHRFGIERLLEDLLPVLDTLDRVLAEAHHAEVPMAEAVVRVALRMTALLDRHGVAAIESLGRRLDPALHEVTGVVRLAGIPPGVVVEEHEKGYLHHDRVLRPAKVVVNAAPESREHTLN